MEKNLNLKSNLFALAAMNKWRFATMRGEVAAEGLFDLPLTSKTGMDLDTVAQGLDKEIKESAPVSFVSSRVKRVETKLEGLKQKLELVVLVIEYKQELEAAAAAKAKVKQQREALLELINKRQADATAALPLDELQAQLAALPELED